MKTLEEIIARLAEIGKEVKAANDVETVTKLGKENEELQTRKAELEDLEQRKKTALDIQAGDASSTLIDKSVMIAKPIDFGKMSAEEVRGTPEYRSIWLKKLQEKPLNEVEERAAIIATAAIPTLTWGKIVEKMEHVSPIISKVTVTQIPSNLTIPKEDTTADVAWVAMDTASTDSEDELTDVALTVHKLIKTVEIGANVQGMSIDAFEGYIINKLHKKMAKAVENGIINGTGSAQSTGLALAGQITNTGEYTNGGMTYEDILTIIADLPDEGYRQDASFLMPSSLFYSDILPALTDKGSGLDVQAVTKKRIFDYETILCDRLATDTLIFGDLSYYHFNWVQAPEMAADKSVGFRTGSTVYRALALADGKLTNAAAFNKYTRASS